MKRLILLCVLSVVIFTTSYAQKEKYQSLYIYNFTKYIKWPESYHADKFIIGVIGDSEIFESLKDMAAKKKTTASGVEMEVIKYKSVTEVGDCNILFVSHDAAGELVQIDTETSSKPILIVTESPGLATQGSVINFVELNDKVKFELNESEASNRGLEVSGALTSLAIVI